LGLVVVGDIHSSRRLKNLTQFLRQKMT